MQKYLTFSDVLLLPNFSDVLPHQTSLKTRLTKEIFLKTPLISSPMDTVTEAEMAISMALNGGIGIIHKNMSIASQVEEVKKVKNYNSLFMYQFFTIFTTDSVAKAKNLMLQNDISSCIVVDKENKLQGIFTTNDLKFVKNLNDIVNNYMSQKVIYLEENVTAKKAWEKIYQAKVTKLPVVNKKHQVIGLVTLKQLKQASKYQNINFDQNQKLLVGAAVGVNDQSFEQIEQLVKAKVDVVVIDSAHGHSKNVLDLTKKVKARFPDLQLIVGNVVTADGVEALCKAGADAIKVGIGSGSICTTRIISGVGAPQLSAIQEATKVAKKFNVPIIGDGGIKYSGDIVKALAAGAETVVLGSLLAGHDQSPGTIIKLNDQKYKSYVGMGSIAAMKRGSSDRYFQSNTKKLVPEGVEALKIYKGNVDHTIYQLLGGIRAGLGYNGAHNLIELCQKARFIEISANGVSESHPHSLNVTKKAPNYD